MVTLVVLGPAAAVPAFLLRHHSAATIVAALPIPALAPAPFAPNPTTFAAPVSCCTYATACCPATRPNTAHSASELPPRRFLPCSPPLTSPAANSPGIGWPWAFSTYTSCSNSSSSSSSSVQTHSAQSLEQTEGAHMSAVPPQDHHTVQQQMPPGTMHATDGRLLPTCCHKAPQTAKQQLARAGLPRCSYLGSHHGPSTQQGGCPSTTHPRLCIYA
jgi:hypothetical protein